MIAVAITILKFSLVVPLDFDADTVLEAIDLVSRAIEHILINSNLRCEFLFLPPARKESFINRIGHAAFRAAANADLGLL